MLGFKNESMNMLPNHDGKTYPNEPRERAGVRGRPGEAEPRRRTCGMIQRLEDTTQFFGLVDAWPTSPTGHLRNSYFYCEGFIGTAPVY